MENNDGNNGNINNIINYNNNDGYNNNNNRDNEEPNDDAVVIPLALRSEMLRMLHQLRVPIYAYAAMGAGGGGGGGGAAIVLDDMEHAAAAVLARSLYDSRPVKHVIDIQDDENGETHGIRTMAYDPKTTEEMKINTACGIWQEEFEEGEEIKILPCNHAFRADALKKWLTEEKAECPICRFKLASKEVIVHPDHVGAGDAYDADEYIEYRNYNNNQGESDDEADDAVHRHPHPQPHHQPQVDEQRARENNIMSRQNNRIHNPAHAGGAADMGRDVYHGISMPMNRLLQMRSGLINGARAGLYSQPAQPSQPSLLPPIVTNINNYYINQYHISAEEQEQADIEEAIRRSLH
jgi:hypothetical protein